MMKQRLCSKESIMYAGVSEMTYTAEEALDCVHHILEKKALEKINTILLLLITR